MAFLSVFSAAASKGESQREESVKLPIVMYHHISENKSLLNKYVITPEEFESDVKYLKENGYTSVLPSQIIDGDIPEKPVMITFDDGFLSTYKYALPILEKYSMTGVCGIIGSLAQEYTDNPNTVSDCAYMDINTVKKLSENGVFETVCHTYDMHSISARKGCAKMKEESDAEYRAALIKDLTRFNELYETIEGAPSDIIAFPYGAYTDATIEIASDCGFKIMLTCDEKVNVVNKTAKNYPLVLGRFNRPHGIASETFFSVWDKQ